MVDRTPAACRQLASRARRKIGDEGGHALAPVDADQMRLVAERFIAACDGADLQPLLSVLDPAVVGWADVGGMGMSFPQPNVGSENVALRVMSMFGRSGGARLQFAEVNGEAGILAVRDGRPLAVIVLDVRDELIAGIYAIVDPRKLARLGAIQS
jgi:RNA polymerase sigma-70 factor (ECF subfamily)